MAKIRLTIENVDSAKERLRKFADAAIAGTLVETSYSGVLAEILRDLDCDAF